MPLHLDEFGKEQLTGYVQNIPPAREYLLKNILPIERTYDMQFAYNVIDGAYAEAASITGWNASAPLRDKPTLARVYGEIAKIQHEEKLDEYELLKFNRPRSDAERAQVIEYVYNMTDRLSEGVDDREESLRAAAIYEGELHYEDKENDVKIDVVFDIPAGNKITVTTKWDQATAKPLSDLQAAVKQFQSKNNRKKPIVMHMTSATEALLLQNEQISIQINGEANKGRLVTSQQMQNVITSLGLPPYAINDDVIVENGVEKPLLPDGRIVLIGADIGKTFLGPTVENNYEPGKFVQPEIFTNPPGQGIIIGEAAFPALTRPQAIVHLNVL
ncbi:major capsid protein [Bacillus badius]|uniref:major capsid protein n=1 Tax=Bacillus badius TaxID=1455 RepID=UPI001CBADE56|nr:major capsid protein [Bacillus badius]UAT29416.1 major capsid protein [Bacillus badius]